MSIKYLNDLDLLHICGGSQPPGQLGYEGQPGNQGGAKHHNNNSNNPPATV